ncbi:hypothetical protein BDF14DRAFT_1936953, partial [Spinellus fusiger]
KLEAAETKDIQTVKQALVNSSSLDTNHYTQFLHTIYDLSEFLSNLYTNTNTRNQMRYFQIIKFVQFDIYSNKN